MMRKIHEEAKNNLRANFKETDLFKVFQSAELSQLSNNNQDSELLASKLPSLVALRDAIYSKEFRDMVKKVMGCDDIIERVDCANAVSFYDIKVQ